MPSPTAKSTAAVSAAPAPSYPAIEALVERATPDELEGFFSEIKDGLGQLKGPKAEQAKKIQAAIASTEELLRHLLQTRESLAATQKPARRR